MTSLSLLAGRTVMFHGKKKLEAHDHYIVGGTLTHSQHVMLYSICLFVCCFTSHVNSYGHCGTVSSPNHMFSWAGLNKRLTSNSCTYFRL